MRCLESVLLAREKKVHAACALRVSRGSPPPPPRLCARSPKHGCTCVCAACVVLARASKRAGLGVCVGVCSCVRAGGRAGLRAWVGEDVVRAMVQVKEREMTIARKRTELAEMTQPDTRRSGPHEASNLAF
jgi:hypothetical protein